MSADNCLACIKTTSTRTDQCSIWRRWEQRAFMTPSNTHTHKHTHTQTHTNTHTHKHTHTQTHTHKHTHKHTHTQTHTHKHTHKHTHTHTHKHTHTNTHTNTHTHTHTHTHWSVFYVARVGTTCVPDPPTHTLPHTHTRTHTHTSATLVVALHLLRRVRVRTHTHTRTQIHTHTHTQIHTHTHTHAHTHTSEAACARDLTSPSPQPSPRNGTNKPRRAGFTENTRRRPPNEPSQFPVPPPRVRRACFTRGTPLLQRSCAALVTPNPHRVRQRMTHQAVLAARSEATKRGRNTQLTYATPLFWKSPQV